MKKHFFAFFILSLFSIANLFSQNAVNCGNLQANILRIQKEHQSIRVSYSSSSGDLTVQYEQDVNANEHLIYTKEIQKKKEKYALISVKSQSFFSKGDSIWNEKSPSEFAAHAWIDSCKQANKIFEKPFEIGRAHV